eukprot:4603487-Pleurochrysis_carterae.AAC.1
MKHHEASRITIITSITSITSITVKVSPPMIADVTPKRIFAGITDPTLYAKTREICILIGEYFQVMRFPPPSRIRQKCVARRNRACCCQHVKSRPCLLRVEIGGFLI